MTTVAFDVGDRVRLTSGAFAGPVGEILSIEAGTWRVRVGLMIPGFGQRVEFDIESAHLVLVERSPTLKIFDHWAECTNPRELFGQLGFHASRRKLRLFVSACYHKLLGWLPEADRVANIIDRAIADPSETDPLPHSLNVNLNEIGPPQITRDDFTQIFRILNRMTINSTNTLQLLAPELVRALRRVVIDRNGSIESLAPVLVRRDFWHLELIRDVFQNPSNPVDFDPVWRTSTVDALARGIYQERAFDRLPILANALQDAGCNDLTLLNHCRLGGAHVRGCWAVDLCLGIE